jgi:hypothetical protein
MEMQNFVELAGSATEIAGVALIVGGFVLAALRWMVLRRPDGSASYLACGKISAVPSRWVSRCWSRRISSEP